MTATNTWDVTDAAQQILRANVDNFPEVDQEFNQSFCVAEEAGEFIGAFRRWKGMARRSGTRAEMEEELADVVIAAHVAAHALRINLDLEIDAKLEKVFSRGWKEIRASWNTP